LVLFALFCRRYFQLPVAMEQNPIIICQRQIIAHHDVTPKRPDFNRIIESYRYVARSSIGPGPDHQLSAIDRCRLAFSERIIRSVDPPILRADPAAINIDPVVRLGIGDRSRDNPGSSWGQHI